MFGDSPLSNFSNIKKHSEALKEIGAVKVIANELATHWAVCFFSLSTILQSDTLYVQSVNLNV